MPSTWKKAKLGEVSRLLASALSSGARRGVVADSSLVVQAGFPTSVADLVVKNRGRLRAKAPRWLLRRHSRPGEGDAEDGCSAVASGAPEIPADTAPPPQEEEEEQPSPVPAGVEMRSGGVGVISGEVARRSPREEDEVAAAARELEKDALQARNGPGFVMPSKVAFLVLFLAIGTQKIALGASISALAILLLESMGRRLIPSSKSCEVTKNKRLGTAAGAASVSGSNARIPIKNFAAFCERSLESKASVQVPHPVPALEPKDRVEAEESRRHQKGSTSNKKAKKLLRKLVPKNLRGTKGEKTGTSGAKANPATDCSRKAPLGRRGEGEEPPLEEEEEDDGAGDGGNKDGEEEGGGCSKGIVVAAGPRDVGVKEAAFLGENGGEPANGIWGHLVFFLIVLSGLAGGRAAALVLTVGWCLLVSSARGLWKCWKMRQEPVRECEMLPFRKL